MSNRNLARREQYLILGLTYSINFFAILGLSREFVTCTFYDNNDDPDPKKTVITLPEIQVILLMTSMTYFFMGNTLEYVRNVEIKIIVPLIALFGILKIFVSSRINLSLQIGVYDIFVDQDIEFIVAESLQLVPFIASLRLGLTMIFIVALSKWFSRKYLHLIMVRISSSSP